MTVGVWPYRWSLRAVCVEHGIKQKVIRPHCPWQNGKVERLNRTLQTELAYRQVFINTERVDALARWLLVLQHSTTPQRTRRTPTDQPPGTNPMAGSS